MIAAADWAPLERWTPGQAEQTLLVRLYASLRIDFRFDEW